MWQRYVLRSEVGLLVGPQGIPGGTMAWKGSYDPATTYSPDDAVMYGGRGFYCTAEATGEAPPTYPDTENEYWSMFSEAGLDGADGTKTIWADLPGSPVRLSDTSLKIIDTSNANGYDLIFSPGTIISWQKSGGGWQVAKIQSATYSANYVTISIMGNTLSDGFTGMKYSIMRACEDAWTVPGMMPVAATTDISRGIRWAEDRYVFSSQVLYDTAPTATGGVWDENDDGVSIFSSKPSIAAGATVGTEVVSDSLAGTATVAVAAKSKMSLDYDSGHATTPGSDATVLIWSMPTAWRYMP